MKVGFIGLGQMGAPIARRLAKCGHEVIGCDIWPETLAAFDEPGTQRLADPIACARASDVLGVCVRTDEQLESLCGDGALFAALGAGGLFVLNSTVAPDLARRLAEKAKAAGVDFVDVGVSGGGPAVEKGELSLWVGGEEAAVVRARPLLEVLGKTISHLGPVGRGMEGKLLNNLVSIANYGMSAAILDLGDQLHFDRSQLSSALMAGSAQSFALRAAPGMMRPYEGAPPGYLDGMHELLKKDVELARQLAPASDPAMAALLASCDALLARIKRAAAEYA
jgi:3-hydroxyisobutyrate dehydrogenase-like beta-hydroxyacid dehydrogenase